jgi:riboflavin synthase
MFTGIVRELGTVAGIAGDERGVRLEVDAPGTAAGAGVGDSVAVGGVCLTVVAVDGPRLAFDAVPETLRRTALGRLAAGGRVNVEPALRAGEPLGGHILQGHVDGVVRYCVEKGSVAVDGVSLTVADLDDEGFAVALVPHTLAVTTLGSLAPGDEVNLEVDVLAKYVERILDARLEG